MAMRQSCCFATPSLQALYGLPHHTAVRQKNCSATPAWRKRRLHSIRRLNSFVGDTDHDPGAGGVPGPGSSTSMAITSCCSGWSLNLLVNSMTSHARSTSIWWVDRAEILPRVIWAAGMKVRYGNRFEPKLQGAIPFWVGTKS